MALIDRFGRRVDYLRLSVTDRCNLGCFYCDPGARSQPRQRSEILSFEESARLAEAGVAAGIRRIRITGGEPLVRKGIVAFCRMLAAIDGLESLALTTNGVLLRELAEPLFRAGVRKINVSLDTLDAGRFRRITGQDLLGEVLSGIAAAEAAGFSPIKINAVVMRGVNDDEVAELAALTRRKAWHVRFIELMPFQPAGSGRFSELFMPVGEIMRRIPGIARAKVGPALEVSGPARMCTLPEALGRVGFIAPLSWHFCGSCNRLRLTADGRMRTCLFSDDEIDLRQRLRQGASTRELVDDFRAAVAAKPRRHDLHARSARTVSGRGMQAIGG